MTTEFDITTVRERFPSLKQPQVYFDNAGGSQILGDVVTSIGDYLTNTNVQLGASYAVGQQSNMKYKDGYEAAAKYINASPEEIVLGPSTTQLFRNLSYALKVKPGDELIVSGIDHEANVASWVSLAERHGLNLKWWIPKDRQNPKLHPEDLKELLSERTLLVTCTHASNILGTIHDIKGIAKMVHTIPGAMLCVDAVAYAPHRPIDVQDLDVDFYAFSWYKVYGPHISMLYAHTRALSTLSPLGHYFNPTSTLENKLGLAASNYELTAALPIVCAYFNSSPSSSPSSSSHPPTTTTTTTALPIGPTWPAIAAHEAVLQSILLTYLLSRPDITLYGDLSADPARRVPTVSFVVRGHGSRSVVERVEQVSAFGFRWGAFYSNRLVEGVLGLGKEGVVRVSMVHYNTVDEIKAFVKTFDEVIPRPP